MVRTTRPKVDEHGLLRLKHVCLKDLSDTGGNHASFNWNLVSVGLWGRGT